MSKPDVYWPPTLVQTKEQADRIAELERAICWLVRTPDGVTKVWRHWVDHGSGAVLTDREIVVAVLKAAREEA